MLYMLDPLTRTYVLVMSFILGTIMASFLTCQADRIANKKDWIKGRSCCDSCGHELHAGDLIPIVSYLKNKGKCKYCGSKIPKSCLYGELLLGVLFVGIVNEYGLTIYALRNLILTCVLFGLSIVDLMKFEIPDGYIITGIVAWLITSLLIPLPFLMQLKHGLLGGFVISGFMLLITLIFEHIAKKEGMGGGDIKLFFMVGLYLGLPVSLLNLILACFIGLIFVLLLKQSKIPFGPSISIATYISLLYGDAIVLWYLSLFF